MTRKYNEQEEFWNDDFSDSYIGRDKDSSIVAKSISLFASALSHAENLNSCNS